MVSLGPRPTQMLSVQFCILDQAVYGFTSVLHTAGKKKAIPGWHQQHYNVGHQGDMTCDFKYILGFEIWHNLPPPQNTARDRHSPLRSTVRHYIALQTGVCITQTSMFSVDNGPLLMWPLLAPDISRGQFLTGWAGYSLNPPRANFGCLHKVGDLPIRWGGVT